MWAFFETKNRIFKYHQSSKGSELVELYRKYDESLANSAGYSDNEYDFMLYIETNYRINFGKILLIKMSNAMLKHYAQAFLTNPETKIITTWSEQIYALNKDKKKFTATITDIEKAFLFEIDYRPTVNTGQVKLTNTEIVSVMSNELSTKIRTLKIDRENWDPTLKSDHYKFENIEKAINFGIQKLNEHKKEIAICIRFFETINNLTDRIGKNKLLDDCILFLKSIEKSIEFTVAELQNIKKLVQNISLFCVALSMVCLNLYVVLLMLFS